MENFLDGVKIECIVIAKCYAQGIIERAIMGIVYMSVLE